MAPETLQDAVKFGRKGAEHDRLYLLRNTGVLNLLVYWNPARDVKAIQESRGPSSPLAADEASGRLAGFSV
jgi:hypothetical protein